MRLKSFPRRTLRGDRTIYRVRRAGRDPWWFSSDGTGRFDPVSTGFGACYFAERDLGAFIEVFRRQMLLAEAEITARSLLSVALQRDVRLADLSSRRALAFGVTASLGANEDYTASQAFAIAAVEARFGGVRYLLRHDPAQQLYGVALFADLAAAPATRWPSGASGALPDDLVAEAYTAFGYRVLPTP